MNYKELMIWQKAHIFTLKIIKVSESVKRSNASDIIVKQLIRASTSIGANIAEGYGRYEGKEYSRFLQFSYSSANEVDNWLNILKDAEMLPPRIIDPLIVDNEEVLRLIAATIKKVKEKVKERKIKETG